MFDHNQYDGLNEDLVVVIHELGHAATWFSYGEGIGRMRFTRQVDRLLKGGTLVEFRDLDEHESDEDAAKYAVERMLAGESAARCLVGMRRDRICSGGVAVSSDDDLRRIVDTASLSRCDDFINVLRLTRGCDPPSWHAWISDRLTCARKTVDENWEAIIKIAGRIVRRLPSKPEKEFRFWGTDLITQLQRSGVRSRVLPALEVVADGETGGLWTKLKRHARRKTIIVRVMPPRTRRDPPGHG